MTDTTGRRRLRASQPRRGRREPSLRGRRASGGRAGSRSGAGCRGRGGPEVGHRTSRVARGLAEPARRGRVRPRRRRVGARGARPARTHLAAVADLADLQRLQAEYVNYRKRVDRDRDVIRDAAVGRSSSRCCRCSTTSTWPARHGDLADGPFAAIADKLEAILGRYGLERLGEAGEAFDPTCTRPSCTSRPSCPRAPTGTARRAGAPARLPHRRAPHARRQGGGRRLSASRPGAG